MTSAARPGGTGAADSAGNDFIPITVVTGFLGAGKTTLILSLLPQLAPDYKVVLLKNEFGDVEVDSKLAEQSSLTAVSEILNGCMCCVLVGQMQTALLEIKEMYHPDRIIIECSGSAFPATLAFQIRELERETRGGLKLDAIITVIDAENFAGYEDTSPTARMQSSYTDIIVVNKWEDVSERHLDTVLDHLHTLNDLTPKIRSQGKNGVDPNLIFGVETKLFLEGQSNTAGNGDVYGTGTHNDEVETVTITRGSAAANGHGVGHHIHTNECGHSHSHDVVSIQDTSDDATTAEQNPGLSREDFVDALTALSKESVWRVKGLVRLTSEGVHVLNWAFGRYEIIPTVDSNLAAEITVLLTGMGERGELKRSLRRFVGLIDAQVE